MIPAILREAARLDGCSAELRKQHREEKHFHWAAPPREAGTARASYLMHATTTPVCVAEVPANNFELHAAKPELPSLHIAGDLGAFRKTLKTFGVIGYRRIALKRWYSQLGPWAFTYAHWQATEARVSRVYRPLPKHPYALFLLFCYRVLRHARPDVPWSGQIPSLKEWHFMTRAAVKKHWQIWAQSNGFTWADFTRVSRQLSAPKPTCVIEGGNTLLAKMCHHHRGLLPIEMFSHNGKYARRHICKPCDNQRRRPQ